MHVSFRMSVTHVHGYMVSWLLRNIIISKDAWRILLLPSLASRLHAVLLQLCSSRQLDSWTALTAGSSDLFNISQSHAVLVETVSTAGNIRCLAGAVFGHG